MPALDKDPLWRRFTPLALDRVDALGVPIDALLDARRWFYLMDHSYDVDSGWEARDLTDAQASALLTLLDEVGGFFAHSDLARRLRARPEHQ